MSACLPILLGCLWTARAADAPDFAKNPATTAPADGPPPSLAERVSAAMQEKTLSWDVTEAVKLSQQGVESGIILAQVQNSTSVQRITSDEIIYLHQQGVAPEITTALIRRGSELSSRRMAVQAPPIVLAQPQPVPQIVYLPAPAQPVSTTFNYYQYERPVPYFYRTTWSPIIYWNYDPIRSRFAGHNRCFRPSPPIPPMARATLPAPGPTVHRSLSPVTRQPRIHR